MALFGALVLGVGCGRLDVEPPAEVTVRLAADPATATVGEDVAFVADAEGPSLLGLVLDYGDGQADSVAAQGATRVTVRRAHAYADPGRYLVTATALDATGLEASDRVTVEIQGAGP